MDALRWLSSWLRNEPVHGSLPRAALAVRLREEYERGWENGFKQGFEEGEQAAASVFVTGWHQGRGAE